MNGHGGLHKLRGGLSALIIPISAVSMHDDFFDTENSNILGSRCLLQNY